MDLDPQPDSSRVVRPARATRILRSTLSRSSEGHVPKSIAMSPMCQYYQTKGWRTIGTSFTWGAVREISLVMVGRPPRPRQISPGDMRIWAMGTLRSGQDCQVCQSQGAVAGTNWRGPGRPVTSLRGRERQASNPRRKEAARHRPERVPFNEGDPSQPPWTGAGIETVVAAFRPRPDTALAAGFQVIESTLPRLLAARFLSVGNRAKTNRRLAREQDAAPDPGRHDLGNHRR